MKNKLICITAILIAAISIHISSWNSLTAFSTPNIMPDGNIFDAEFYAANNPDVVTALGNDEDVLYMHYVKFGKKERRAATGELSLVSVSKYPAVIDKLTTAFLNNDYVTINSISANFSKYEKELSPYITQKTSTAKRYNFNTPAGEFLILTNGPSGEYKSIVNMGLAMMGHATGDPIVAKTNSDNNKRKANWGWNLSSDQVYGKDTFILGDRWTSYTLCTNGYEYIEISTDGFKYGSLQTYQKKIGARPQAAVMHFGM